MGEARHPVGDHVDRAVSPFKPAPHLNQRLGPDHDPVALVHRRRHDDVRHAVLVLEQEEHDPLRRPGPLAGDDDAGGGGPTQRVRAQVGGCPQDGIETRAEEGERVRACGEAHRLVIDHHALPRGHVGKAGGG
jgi:hypothetical protein